MNSKGNAGAPEERDFHVEGATGAILTKLWPGGHKPAYSPLTHFVVAAKSPTGVVLMEAESGDFWSLPGGPVTDAQNMLEDAAARFQEQTGLQAREAAVMGYFRIVSPESVEYGALIVCQCGAVDGRRAKELGVELRTWECRAALRGIDAISAALAGAAVASRYWQG
jgi:hypothetical protein